MDVSLLLAVSVTLLGFGLVSRRAERSPVTPPMVFLTLGLLLSERGLGLFRLEVEGAFVHGLAELTLVLVLFTDAARIDLACLRREESLPARLLLLGLPLAVAAGALAAAAVLPGLRPVDGLLLAAILAPTDAALGQAVVSNRAVPLRIRQSLNAESGLNDGLALPIVLLFAALAAEGGSAVAASHWAAFLAGQLVLGPVIGAAVGAAGGRLLERAMAAGLVNDAFQRIAALGLALSAFAGAELLGGNGFIAAFAAGLTLGNVARAVCPCLYGFGEAEGQLLTLLIFLVFGAVIVPEALARADAAALLYAALSLTAVRMVPTFLALAGSGLRLESRLFLGWFGPRGLASVLFTLLIVERGGIPSAGRIETIVTLTVLLSAFVHGVSAWPLARVYARRVGAAGEGAEHAAVPDMPVRLPHTE